MTVLPVNEAPRELLEVFHTAKESVLAHYYEPEPGLFIAESAKVALRALDAGYEPVALLTETGLPDQEVTPLLERLSGIPAYEADPQRFREIAGYPMTRGVLCAFRRKKLPDTRRLLASLDTSVPSPRRRIAVLDHVVNPSNIGSIFRNAAALEMDAVLLTNGCCDPLARRSIRVSMGCVFQVPWTVCGEGAGSGALPDLLRQSGYRTAALALTRRSISLRDPRLRKENRLALILGNEGSGLDPETIEACDYTVRIPMREGVDSLNVAAASAIAFWAV